MNVLGTRSVYTNALKTFSKGKQRAWITTARNPITNKSLTTREEQLINLSLCETIEWLASKQTTAVELTTTSIKQMKDTTSLNMFTSTLESSALETARLSDKRREIGEPIGKLEGIPLALKDNFCLSKTVTTAGSKLLSNYVPPYDATIVSRLQQAGAVIIGKTNMDEFSMGSSSITGANGPVVNPWGTQCVAGGSSGGSAAAVAARVCYGAMGSDTGGSVRLPAAYCGVVGLKPSYGRVSRWGLISYASSLDTPGVLARSVPDAATILEVISGIDTHDSSSIPEQPLSKTLDKRKTLEGVRIGIPKEYHVQELDLDTVKVWETAAKQLLEAGAEVFEVSLPHTSDALLAYYILATAEAASNLARYDGLRFGDTGYKKTVEELQNITANDIYLSTRNKGFGEEVQRRIILGTHVLSRDSYESYYRKAQQIRRLVLQDFTSVFEQGVDMLLTPTAPQAAYPITSSLRPHQYYTQDIMTVPASMAGLPAISLPVNLDANGMPIAVQLIAPPHADVDLISIANCIESLFLRTAA